MANAIDETENVLILAVILLILGIAIWGSSKIPDLEKWLRNLLNSLSGKEASDAAGGAGWPGQPGYVSPIENINRWSGLIFGTGNSNPDPGSATEDQQQAAIDKWIPPTNEGVEQGLTQFAPEAASLVSGMQTDPAATLQALGIF